MLPQTCRLLCSWPGEEGVLVCFVWCKPEWRGRLLYEWRTTDSQWCLSGKRLCIEVGVGSLRKLAPASLGCTIEYLNTSLHAAQVMFGKWDDVLAIKEAPGTARGQCPLAGPPYAVAILHYARTLALAARAERAGQGGGAAGAAERERQLALARAELALLQVRDRAFSQDTAPAWASHPSTKQTSICLQHKHLCTPKPVCQVSLQREVNPDQTLNGVCTNFPSLHNVSLRHD